MPLRFSVGINNEKRAYEKAIQLRMAFFMRYDRFY